MSPARGLGLAACMASALLAPGMPAHADLDDVREELTRDIQTAQRELAAVQESISGERAALSEQLSSAQNRVLDLRQRAVAARRLADEETLTLSRIESRLAAWREQSTFQSRLLAAYLDRSGRRSLAEVREVDLRADLAVLAAHLEQQESRLYPGWQSASLVLPQGEIEDAELLTLGPVQWFRQADAAGLVRAGDEVARASVLFDGAARSGIEDLHRDGEGVVTFDPTLSRALLLAEDRETLWQHLRSGGIWVVPILLFALVASITAIGKAVWVYRLPPLMPALAERFDSARREGPAAVRALTGELRGPQAELLEIALAGPAADERDDRLYAALLTQRGRLERWLGVIAVTASVAPLLGLLGTVSGMITTFRLMTLFGAGDANAVSAGISEALVTTELGLVVAIPALLAHALLSRKVKSYFSRLESDAVELSRLPAGTASA